MGGGSSKGQDCIPYVVEGGWSEVTHTHKNQSLPPTACLYAWATEEEATDVPLSLPSRLMILRRGIGERENRQEMMTPKQGNT